MEYLKDSIKSCDNKLIIVSPYIASDIKSFLKNFDFSNIKYLDIITTFKPNDKEQLTKPLQLLEIIKYFEENYKSIKLKIHIDNLLHGKIYFFINEKERKAIFTSANFTKNGMSDNHEFGIIVDDEKIIEQAMNDIFDNIDYEDITFTQLDKCRLFAEEYIKANPIWIADSNIKCDILDDIYTDNTTISHNTKYFIKPIGHTDNPIKIEDKRDFSELHQNLHFSKKLPRGVRKGDVLITTAIGAGSIVSWFKIISETVAHIDNKISDKKFHERWPWYFEGRNQAQKFSSVWWKYNLKRKNLVLEFIDQYPNNPITKAGSYTLDSINYGNDKIEITKKFARFIIDKIQKIEEELELN